MANLLSLSLGEGINKFPVANLVTWVTLVERRSQ